MRTTTRPPFPIVLCISQNPKNLAQYYFVFTDAIFGAYIAVSDPFNTVLTGVAALEKLYASVGQPLTKDAAKDAIRGMKQRDIPLGIGFLAFVLLPLVNAVKKIKAISPGNIARRNRVRGEQTTPRVEPHYDIKLTACNGEHHHLGLYQGEKMVTDEIIQIQDGIEPLYTVLLRWTIRFGIPPQTVATLEHKLYQLLDENAVYTLGLDPGNELVQSTMLVFKNGGLIARRTVETATDVIEVLTDVIQSQDIPAIAHAGLIQDALDLAYNMPATEEPPAPEFTVEIKIEGDSVTAIVALRGTNLTATTHFAKTDEGRAMMLTSFIVNNVPGSDESSVIVLEALRQLDDALGAENDITVAVSDSVDAARASTGSSPAPVVTTGGDGEESSTTPRSPAN